jgi:DNA-directed RNA polymerase specialized sigma24 family protein
LKKALAFAADAVGYGGSMGMRVDVVSERRTSISEDRWRRRAAAHRKTPDSALRSIRKRLHHTLEPSALVNELCIRLLGAEPIAYRDRAHFFAIALDQALSKLEKADPRAARVVELRFFGGLQEEEIADVLGVSVIMVKRDWRVARARLIGRLQPDS